MKTLFRILVFVVSLILGASETAPPAGWEVFSVSSPFTVEPTSTTSCAMSEVLKTRMLSLGFTKVVCPFGVIITGTAAYPESYLRFAANLVAEMLDEDQDGNPNNPAVLSAITTLGNGKGGILACGVTQQEESVLDQFNDITFALSCQTWIDFDPGSDERRGTLREESFHLVHTKGWSTAYPSIFGVHFETFQESLVCRETARLQCVSPGYSHPENQCPNGAPFPPGSPATSPLPCAAGWEECCNEPFCDCAEFFHLAIMVALGGSRADDPSTLGLSVYPHFPSTKAAVLQILSDEFKAAYQNPIYKFITKAPRGEYSADVAEIPPTTSAPSTATQPMTGSACGCEVAGSQFCNHDEEVPFCEPCPTSELCSEIGVPPMGVVSCETFCRAIEMTQSPTPPPTQTSTMPPTPEPTAASSGGDFCFSGESTVLVGNDNGGGNGFTTPVRVPMKELKIGDLVATDRNSNNYKFERVYSFGHRDIDKYTSFLQILPSKLELSSDHMVFVKRRGAIPASTLKVGDQLISGHDANGKETTIVIESIQSVVRQGVYAPFTPSGKIVVNGILASNYVALQQHSDVLRFCDSIKTPFSFHWLEHSFQFFHRLHSYWLGMEDRMLANGFSVGTYLPRQMGVWFLNQHPLLIAVMIVPIVVMLTLFSLFEQTILLFSATFVGLAMGCFVSIFLVMSIKRRQLKNSKATQQRNRLYEYVILQKAGRLGEKKKEMQPMIN